MSTYEYTDNHGTELSIEGRLPDGVYMGLETRRSILAAIIPFTEAPAMALAILESAGIRPSQEQEAQGHAERYASVSVESLRYCLEYRAKEAEREAEDVKVDDYRRLVYRQAHNGLEPAADWSDFGTDGKAHWRNRYREALEFFTSEEIIPAEVVEPRTVASSWDLGPEHRDAEWQDNAGCYWRSIDHTWKWRSRPDAAWHCLSPEGFPWTEVL